MARVRKHYDATGSYTGKDVKQYGCLSAIGWILGVGFLVGLTVQYWYISVPVVILIVTALVVKRRKQQSDAGTTGE